MLLKERDGLFVLSNLLIFFEDDGICHLFRAFAELKLRVELEILMLLVLLRLCRHRHLDLKLVISLPKLNLSC